ncbi:hypothetical protein PR048_017587 [Dryococelus australis]|uniref:Uncharacterized protein n=1 Tax=Dryococelus australis TaxID=614101 RepID=A0ABQ9HA04_9NEOP|nr:hypothetical protein PR048_017587 [Dryococelus australis]
MRCVASEPRRQHEPSHQITSRNFPAPSLVQSTMIGHELATSEFQSVMPTVIPHSRHFPPTSALQRRSDSYSKQRYLPSSGRTRPPKRQQTISSLLPPVGGYYWPSSSAACLLLARDLLELSAYTVDARLHTSANLSHWPEKMFEIPLANQRLVTNPPAGLPANRKYFAARSSQLPSRSGFHNLAQSIGEWMSPHQTLLACTPANTRHKNVARCPHIMLGEEQYVGISFRNTTSLNVRGAILLSQHSRLRHEDCRNPHASSGTTLQQFVLAPAHASLGAAMWRKQTILTTHERVKMRSGATLLPRNRTRFAPVRGEQSDHYATAAPKMDWSWGTCGTATPLFSTVDFFLCPRLMSLVYQPDHPPQSPEDIIAWLLAATTTMDAPMLGHSSKRRILSVLEKLLCSPTFIRLASRNLSYRQNPVWGKSGFSLRLKVSDSGVWRMRGNPKLGSSEHKDSIKRLFGNGVRSWSASSGEDLLEMAGATRARRDDAVENSAVGREGKSHSRAGPHANGLSWADVLLAGARAPVAAEITPASRKKRGEGEREREELPKRPPPKCSKPFDHAAVDVCCKNTLPGPRYTHTLVGTSTQRVYSLSFHLLDLSALLLPKLVSHLFLLATYTILPSCILPARWFQSPFEMMSVRRAAVGADNIVNHDTTMADCVALHNGRGIRLTATSPPDLQRSILRDDDCGSTTGDIFPKCASGRCVCSDINTGSVALIGDDNYGILKAFAIRRLDNKPVSPNRSDTVCVGSDASKTTLMLTSENVPSRWLILYYGMASDATICALCRSSPSSSITTAMNISFLISLSSNAAAGCNITAYLFHDAAQEQTTVRLLASHQGDPGSIPGRAITDFRMWESCRMMPLVSGFSQGSPARLHNSPYSRARDICSVAAPPVVHPLTPGSMGFASCSLASLLLAQESSRARMKQRRNVRARETGDPRDNPSGTIEIRGLPHRFALVGGEQSNR